MAIQVSSSGIMNSIILVEETRVVQIYMLHIIDVCLELYISLKYDKSIT